MTTILYTEKIYADPAMEAEVFGPDVRVIHRDVGRIADLGGEDCRSVDGIMLFRHYMTAADFSRFPRLRAIVRMGVG